MTIADVLREEHLRYCALSKEERAQRHQQRRRAIMARFDEVEARLKALATDESTTPEQFVAVCEDALLLVDHTLALGIEVPAELLERVERGRKFLRIMKHLPHFLLKWGLKKTLQHAHALLHK